MTGNTKILTQQNLFFSEVIGNTKNTHLQNKNYCHLMFGL